MQFLAHRILDKPKQNTKRKIYLIDEGEDESALMRQTMDNRRFKYYVK